MGKQSQYQFTVYADENLGSEIIQAIDEREQSESEWFREAARRELQRMEIEA